MNTKPRERILILAILLGVAAAVMIWAVMSSGKQSPADTQTPVVVAAGNIPSGMIVTGMDLGIRNFNKEEVPPGAASSEALVIGKVTKTDIRAGQPVLVGSLRTSGEQLTDLVPRFMRAVTVGLDPVSGVAGFLKPGNRVDVVATFDMNNTSYAKTVLQNVLLIAINSEAIAGGDNVATDKTTARAEPTATLAVSPSDAEKLVLADAKGKLRLTLRSSDDKSIAARRPIGTQVALGVAQQNPATAKPAPAPLQTFRAPVMDPLPVFPSQFSSNSTGDTSRGNPGKTIVMVKGSTLSETQVSE